METSEMPEDQWLSLSDFQQINSDQEQYLWLSEYGSMTQRLTEFGDAPIKVDVLCAKQGKPTVEERLFLNIQQRQWAYIREVTMNIHHSPWLYGRTIMPMNTISGSGGQLKLLGNKPLGQVLFADRKNRRQFIEVAKISKDNQLYPAFMKAEQVDLLWARRSLFIVQESYILVQEVFLPSCPLKLP